METKPDLYAIDPGGISNGEPLMWWPCNGLTEAQAAFEDYLTRCADPLSSTLLFDPLGNTSPD